MSNLVEQARWKWKMSQIQYHRWDETVDATYMYGIQGGFVSANACRYARKLELESINAQYSFSPSVIVLCHSSLKETNDFDDTGDVN